MRKKYIIREASGRAVGVRVDPEGLLIAGPTGALSMLELLFPELDSTTDVRVSKGRFSLFLHFAPDKVDACVDRWRSEYDVREVRSFRRLTR